ncbi:unnamed protein product [Effrenium voratum]|nr:unnamed protein product [Effrenium voratum]
MAQLATLDTHGRHCLGCQLPMASRANGRVFRQREDCGNQSVFEYPQNLRRPLRSGVDGFNACELNFGKTCADAVFNRDFLMMTKSVNLSRATAAHDHAVCLHNGWLNASVRALQHDFDGLKGAAKSFCDQEMSFSASFADYLVRFLRSRPWHPGAVPSAEDARWLGRFSCLMGTAACDMAHCAYSFCEADGKFGLYEECDGWDPVKGMPHA